VEAECQAHSNRTHKGSDWCCRRLRRPSITIRFDLDGGFLMDACAGMMQKVVE